MGGKLKLLVACALAGALAVPLGAAAETAADAAEKPGADERRHDERLHLDCKAFSRDGEHAVGCHWSPSKSRDFAGYRLMRAARDEAPAAVAATSDRRETKALDRSVAAGRDYLYVVQAVDAAGEVIAQSNPVRVRTSARGHERPAPALPGLGLA